MIDGPRVGIIGGSGWLGGAIAVRLIETGFASPERLALSFRSSLPNRIRGAWWTKDNQELADRSDVVILSVRPEDWPSLRVWGGGKLVISVMAGIQLQDLADGLATRRVIRSLPNAAAEVGKSYTPWVATAEVTDPDRAIARDIFDACGTADEVATEADIDYFTGLTGSGPAFPALLAAAMMKDAEARGFKGEIARRAVTAVLVGAGRLMELHDENPADTVETFVAYRGTTAAAIEAMRAAGFEAAIANGLYAARQKSVSMGQRS
jgi:pyrroline-5-carboxylate reductase